MVNITPAKVTTSDAVAEVDAVLAAMRPLAGFGAGAFTCDGAGVGSRVGAMVARRPRPRLVLAAIGMGHAYAGAAIGHAYQPSIRAAGMSTVGNGTVSTSTVSTSTVSNKQLNLMTRINPVTPGGLGPHPAREPEPV